MAEIGSQSHFETTCTDKPAVQRCRKMQRNEVRPEGICGAGTVKQKK